MKLQVNTKGAWRQVLDFGAEQLAAVIEGLVPLARALGSDVRWSVVHDDGHRVWLGSLTQARHEAAAEHFTRDADATGV